MRVVPPLEITDARLTSSTAGEPASGEIAWNAATPYNKGNRVYLASTHMRYERLVAGTTAASPDVDTVNWAPLGPTNRWAMFDLLRNTGTTAASPLVVTITPGQRIDTLALLGLVADSVSIEVKSGSTVVLAATEGLSTRQVLDWYDYFTEEFTYRSSLARFDIPALSNVVVKVTASRASGDVTIGALVVGKSVYLGEAEYSAESDALNFSTISRDAFGNSTLIQRRSVPKANLTVWCDKARVRKLLDTREALNAVPALWSGLDDATDGYFDAVLILGPYKRWLIGLDHPDHARQQLELEEV